MRKLFALIPSLLVVFFILQSCEKEEVKPKISKADSIYYFIDELMQYWYLWNESLPEVDYLKYDEPQKLMDDLTVDADKWSFVDKAETVSSYFKEGEDFGFGFFLAWDENYNLRVILAYNNTDAYANGIRRGCIITRIDDTDVRQIQDFSDFFSSDPGTMKFYFLDLNGAIKTVTLTKQKYFNNAVLFSDIYEVNGKKTGYLVLQSFLGYATAELDKVFTDFVSEGIDELIVDLRYNSGGYISNAQTLANRIAPVSAVGKTFFTMKHNSSRSMENDTTVVIHSDSLALNLNRVFFITNEYSASASELLINGLSPLMDVKTLGETTYGKPVAMYGFEFQDWIVYPVTAKSVNAVGYGDYFSGLRPGREVIDPLKYNWGNINDPALSDALHYIEFGSYGVVAMAHKKSTGSNRIEGAKYFGKNWLLR